MNNQRRRFLRYVISVLLGLEEMFQDKEKFNESMALAVKKLDYCIAEEDCAIDAIPENMQYSDRYDMMQENLDDLESAMGEIEIIQEVINDHNGTYKDIASNVKDAIKYITSAIERR